MNQDEYIEQRLDDQIKWYSDKSSVCQKKHKSWQVIKIIAALLITTLSLWATNTDTKIGTVIVSTFMTYVIGILGAFIVFIESFVKIFDYKKLWIEYRMASEKLKREKLLFQTKSDPYNISDSFILLVKRCESIMQSETHGWEEVQAEKDN